VRRDDYGTLKEANPFDLLNRIRADYAERPVPRDLAALRVSQAARRWS